MAGPWERYQGDTSASAGPWSRYAQEEAPQSLDDRRRAAASGATLQFATPFGRIDTGVSLPQGATELLAGAGRRLTEIGTLGNREKTKADQLLDSSGYATAGSIVADLATMIGGGGALRGIGTGVARLAPRAGTALQTAGQSLVGPQNMRQALGAGAAYGGATANGDAVDRLAGAGFGAAGGAAGRALVSAPGAISRALSPQVSPEVSALAKRAQDLGINLRADQVANSKPLNAVSAALDYVPFSGSGPAKQAQQKQFNAALAKTIGEATDNPALAIQQAERRLGGEFDRVLKDTAVRFDNSLFGDLNRIASEASSELSDAQFGVIAKQVANLQSKASVGEAGAQIDGAAAYNIKKQLDRLASSPDSSLAYYAKELRGSLFEALNRSLGPDEAAKFATTRQQWGNLRELQKLVPAGAEGDVSAARLAGAKGRIRGNDLSELSDIAGQFLKGRIGDSGTAQRVQMGAAPIAFYLDPFSTAAGMGAQIGAGRAANALMGARPVVNYLREGVAPGARNVLEQVGGNPELQYMQPVVNSLLLNSYAR